MIELEITDEIFEKHLSDLLSRIEKKNPIAKVARNSQGNVLIHSSDVTSLQNLLKTEVGVSEVCATAGSLRVVAMWQILGLWIGRLCDTVCGNMMACVVFIRCHSNDDEKKREGVYTEEGGIKE